MMRAKLLFLSFFICLVSQAGSAHAQTKTTLPISAELGTSIAESQFPLGLRLETVNLLVTEPGVLFPSTTRLAMQVRFQAYDHRPDEGIAISEMGRARFSGELDFDPATREILLHDPRVDQLTFDRDNAVTKRLLVELRTAWDQQAENPLRTEFPQHPFVAPFKEFIQDVSYDGKNITLEFSYGPYQP